MHSLELSFDPLNPGQFYACCGLLELFELGGLYVESQFEVDSERPRNALCRYRSAQELSIEKVACQLKMAAYVPGSIGEPPHSDSIAPISCQILGSAFSLDWWLDEYREKASFFKCWAGQVTTRKLFEELPTLLREGGVSLDLDAYTSTRLGIDPRSAWLPINLGYSPNEQGQQSRTFPLVELLAAFGLQGFRPAGDRARGFRYSLWLDMLPHLVARTVAVEPWAGLRAARYKFNLRVRGSYKFFDFAESLSV